MNLTREEFERLADAYAIAYGIAVHKKVARPDEYQAALSRTAEARDALIRAVLQRDMVIHGR